MATCFEFNSCHLNTSFHCTWMNPRQKQDPHQEITPSGFGLSDFLWTCFRRSGNPPAMKSSGGLNRWAVCMVWGIQSSDYGGALERELFSHSVRPLAKSKLLSRLFLALLAKAPQINYPLLMSGKSLGELGGGAIPICIFAAMLLDKVFKDSPANRCAIPRRGLGLSYVAKRQHEMEY